MTSNENRGARGCNRRTGGQIWSGTTAAALGAALLFGCGGSDAGGHGSPVPKELVGQWQTAIAGPAGVNDYAGGEVPNIPDMIEIQSSVLGIAFYFFEDGRYQLVWLWQTAYANVCGREISWDEHGTLAIGGSAFTFQPGSAMFRMLDSCSPGLTTEKPAHTKNLTVQVTRQVNRAGAEQLRLRYPSGSELVLDKLIKK